MRRTFLSPDNAKPKIGSFKNMLGTLKDARLSTQMLQSTPVEGVPTLKQGVVTLRPQLEEYCQLLQKENSDLKEIISCLKQELQRKNQIINRLESDKLMQSGKKSQQSQKQSLFCIQNTLMKQQLQQNNKKLAESQVCIQQLRASLDSMSANTSLQFQIQKLTDQLAEHSNNLQVKQRELNNSMFASSRLKDQVKRLESELGDAMRKSESFRFNLESDKAMLQELKEEVGKKQKSYDAVMAVVNVWEGEFTRYRLEN